MLNLACAAALVATLETAMECLLSALGELAAYAQAHPFASAATAAMAAAWLLGSGGRSY